MNITTQFESSLVEMIVRRMKRVSGLDVAGLLIKSRFAGKAGHIYNEVERRLATGVYRFGSEISNLALVQEFGASRAPVTMALNLLQAAGYLIIKPQMGVWVAAPSDEEIAGFFRLTAKAESVHAMAAARRGNAAQLSILETIHGHLDEARPDGDMAARIERLSLEILFQGQIRLMAGTPWLCQYSASAWRMSNFLIAGRSGAETAGQARTQSVARASMIRMIGEGDAAATGELMEEFVVRRFPIA